MVPPVARRFVAGETPAEALDHVRELNRDDVGALLNLLGEHYDERARAREDADAYCDLVDDIGATGLQATVSVKPTQLGLAISEEVFRETLARIVERAADRGTFVWIDMEDYPYTDATLDAYEHHALADGNVGVCIQANLRRTRDDLERLAPLPGKVRLVKGAYSPPEDIAFQSASRVNQAFRRSLRFMFEHFEDGIAVGSHDPDMVDLAGGLHDEHGTPYEVQMLMGVRSEAQRELARDRDVAQYVPFGAAWLSYFYRRVRERKENALFALRALVQG
ncbi:MAG: proline dehydrogenase family protein [Haloarculaceae archaeon]